ncbi:DUF2171 domain-containing protein [Gluconobacter sp. P5E10]|uniref:DUF2171 domain-containing protein n=1 Tax=Gluconobacter sp. P5E10 TaxID=2762613 RepID=UPI001C0434D4|nr:DUF2171 domain-containing protein [Gluconobacter sp. P5E10]
MSDLTNIKKGSEIIGADGVHMGYVAKIEKHRIQISQDDLKASPRRYISVGLIADIENGTVRLSANADVAITLED